MTTSSPSIPAGLKAWLAGKGLTPRERDVVAAYLQLREAGDGVIGPTQAEIADALGIARSAIHEHIGKLVGKGVFERANYKRAGIRLLWDERAEDGSGAASLRAEVRLALPELLTVARAINESHAEAAILIRARVKRMQAAAEESA